MSWAQLTWQFLVVALTAGINTAVSLWILTVVRRHDRRDDDR